LEAARMRQRLSPSHEWEMGVSPAISRQSRLPQQFVWTSFVKPNEVNGQFHSQTPIPKG
jgi:hypothetical protein